MRVFKLLLEILDFGFEGLVFLYFDLQKPGGEADFFLYAPGRELVDVGAAVLGFFEVGNLDQALVGQGPEAVVDLAQGCARNPGQFPLGDPGIVVDVF